MNFPTHNIPDILKRDTFRFALVQTNGKCPIEKKWNSDNCYKYDDPKLLAHTGNYMVCTGYGQLVVLDLDDKEFSQSDTFTRVLPPTFTVLSAGKRLPHLYYILKGEMFKKTNIRDDEGKVLMDIQSIRAGVVGPNSVIDRRYYQIHNELPIAEIELETLQREFYMKTTQRSTKWDKVQFKDNTETASETVKAFQTLCFEQHNTTLFKCPFHDMEGKGNLNVIEDSGAIYCFHEQKYWPNLDKFMIDYGIWRSKNGSS